MAMGCTGLNEQWLGTSCNANMIKQIQTVSKHVKCIKMWSSMVKQPSMVKHGQAASGLVNVVVSGCQNWWFDVVCAFHAIVSAAIVISDMLPVRGVWGIGRCCSHGVRLVAIRNRNLHLFQCCQGQRGHVSTLLLMLI